jgi:tRNA(fMet)-specific endonuclease VapC
VYLLDTNACIRILNKSAPPLIARLQRHDPSELTLCAIVKAELLFGARRSDRVAENLTLLAAFFAPFPCFPFDDAGAEEYATIRADLARAGTPIGPNDLIIAAAARAHGLILVTHNVDEFGRVAELRIEDWEAPV